jgi:hypothetical protein
MDQPDAHAGAQVPSDQQDVKESSYVPPRLEPVGSLRDLAPKCAGQEHASATPDEDHALLVARRHLLKAGLYAAPMISTFTVFLAEAEANHKPKKSKPPKP